MLLASRQLVAETENWECYTELGNGSDHDMLVASFDFVAHKGSETGLSTRDKAWARAGDKVRSVTKMSRSMAARFKSIVLAKCKDALEGLAQTLGWHKARAALAGGSAGEIEKVRNQLKHAQADLAKVVIEAAWGPEKPRKVKHDKGYKRLRLRILRLRAMREAIARAGGQLVPEPLFVTCIKGCVWIQVSLAQTPAGGGSALLGPERKYAF